MPTKHSKRRKIMQRTASKNQRKKAGHGGFVKGFSVSSLPRGK